MALPNVEKDLYDRLLKLVETDPASPYNFILEDVRELRFVLRKIVNSWFDLANKQELSKEKYQDAALAASGQSPEEHEHTISWRAACVVWTVLDDAAWGIEEGILPGSQDSDKTLKQALDAIKDVIGWMSAALMTDGSEDVEFSDPEDTEKSTSKTGKKTRRGQVWTDRENLELLRLEAEREQFPTFDDRGAELQRRMEAFRRQHGQDSVEGRTNRAYEQQAGTLKSRGVTIQDLEEALGEAEEGEGALEEEGVENEQEEVEQDEYMEEGMGA